MRPAVLTEEFHQASILGVADAGASERAGASALRATAVAADCKMISGDYS